MIEKYDIKQLIVFYITDVGGCKLTDLVSDFPSRQINHEVLIALGEFDMNELAMELYKEGRINIVQYIVPSEDIIEDESEEEMRKKARAFLLPKGAMVWEPRDN